MKARQYGSTLIVFLYISLLFLFLGVYAMTGFLTKSQLDKPVSAFTDADANIRQTHDKSGSGNPERNNSTSAQNMLANTDSDHSKSQPSAPSSSDETKTSDSVVPINDSTDLSIPNSSDPSISITPAPTSAPAEELTENEPANTEKDVSEKPEVIFPINSFKHETNICLTFDDGGNKKAVTKALEILKKNDVKCTFFITGKYLKLHSTLWIEALEQGHQICNHTQNHRYLAELSSDEVKKEILEWEATATEVFGEEYVENMKREFPYIRLPGSSGHNSKRVLGILAELGYVPVGWNIETYYAVLRHHNLNSEPALPIADEVVSHVIKRAKGGSIILLHFNPYDTEKLEDILTELINKGLNMGLLSDHLS